MNQISNFQTKLLRSFEFGIYLRFVIWDLEFRSDFDKASLKTAKVRE